MEKYTLYLDESTTHKGNYQNQVFSMAGVIIKNADYYILESELNCIKTKLWYDIPNPTQIILHQMEVNEATHNRNKKHEFDRFKKNGFRVLLYNGLSSLFDTGLLTVLGTTIKLDALNQYFVKGIKSDPYLISLQMIMENYCHFLFRNNAVGEIIYESRNQTEDERMRNRFYHIKLMGSMYIDANIMNKYLLSIVFEKKENNNTGLQIADFVPNYFARKALGLPTSKISIDKKLRIYRYDGGLNLRNRFGVKNMP